MPLPQVKISHADGQLGRTAPVSEHVALFHTAKAVTSKFQLGQGYTLYSPAEAVSKLGFGSTKNADFLSQIKDFYSQAPHGTPLVVGGIAATMGQAQLFQVGGILETMLKQQNGRISLLCISHLTHNGAQPYGHAGGLKGKIQESPAYAQNLVIRAKARSQPLHVLIGGHENDTLGALADYSHAGYHHVSMLISSIRKDSKTAAVGFLAGHLATLPAQRKLSRVRNGALAITHACFTNGLPADEAPELYETLHRKRYLFFRAYTGKSGYYVTDDTVLASPASDFSSIAANRVINKATRLSYQVFIHEIGEEVTIDEDGTLSVEAARYYEGLIENAIGAQMVAAGELNDAEAFVDPSQKVIQNDKLTIALRLQPVGYTSFIEIQIGFSLTINA